MKIVSGLLKSMVMPRNAENVSSQNVSGNCRGEGDVFLMVAKAGAKKPVIAKRVCGKAAKGCFSAVLYGIPCGGPYTVTLECEKESVTVYNVYVGEVWIMAGQSNMQGCGFITGKHENKNQSIRAYYTNNTWDMATEPVNDIRIALAPAHRALMQEPPARVRKAVRGIGAGCGLPFAVERFRQTGVPQGLIACAHGGTRIGMWDPADLDKGYGSLYGAMIERVRLNGGRVSGMLWYQGCSDCSEAHAPEFAARTLDMFKAVRRDLKAPNMPIVQVQLARVVNEEPSHSKYWSQIRDDQRVMPRKLKNLLTVPTIDLDLEDTIHLNEASHLVLGRRMAEAMQTILKEPGALPPPIELDAISYRHDRKNGAAFVDVSFKNVVGSLHSNGRPSGFTFDRENNDITVSAVCNKNKVSIRCAYMPRSIGYGLGFSPYCNIVDDAGRAVPAFALQEKMTAWISGEDAHLYTLSEPCYATADLSKVTLKMANGLKYGACQFARGMILYPDRIEYKDKEGVRFFKSRYYAKEDVDFRFALGYDGNIRLFVDGKAVYTDLHAHNPIIPGSHMVNFHWKKGYHDVVIALGMTHGCTWGAAILLEVSRKSGKAVPVEVEQ